LTTRSDVTNLSHMTEQSEDPDEHSERVGRAQRRASRTRERLIRAALALFCEKGVDATTIEEITERADVGKGTFYRHFSDKYELVIALIEDAISKLLDLINAPPREPETLEELLEHFLSAHSAFFADNSEEFAVLFAGRVLLKLRGDVVAELEQPYVRYLQEIERKVSPFVSKRIDPMKVRRLACAVAGFVFGFFSFATLGMTEEEIDTSLRPFRRAFVSGLSAFLGR